MAQKTAVNPFQTLYLTEALSDPDLYWHLFSPKIITGEAERLFRVGNVVLLGSNGTGKTMLLRLFSPAVQAAYKRHGIELPLPENAALLSVSVNLLHAGFSALGRRRPRLSEDDVAPASDRVLWPLMMGDLLNYAIVAEMLATIEMLTRSEGGALAKALKARIEPRRLNAFATWVAKRDCWFGALRGVGTFDGLVAAVNARILTYRKFINWNADRLPSEITASKTEVGVPIADCRRGLSECEVMDGSVPFMVAIDQYESLLHTEYDAPSKTDSLGMQFCRVANALLAMRDPTVSYKFGVRPYGWSHEPRVFGTDARLEVGRDYQMVNLDDVLRRKENTRSWTFPDFADDVASRRIAAFHKATSQEEYRGWLRKRLEVLTPDEELEKYCARDPERLLPRGEEWPREWRALVQEEYRRSKFGAKLAETWITQTLGKAGRLPAPPPADTPSTKKPWLRDWWTKERREALKTQIASTCRQRRVYGGWDVLMTLSASNVLVFLSLCREIWDINERSRRDDRSTDDLDEVVSTDVQSQAIRVVAETWLRKQTEFPGGSRRKDFVTRLGIGIRKALLADKGLVYPGHNGFSLVVDEYEAEDAADVREFLENATDFGALISSPHTTKELDRKPRRKWYLFPILCPNFEIPAVRTKEPYYAELAEVREWLSDARPEIVFRGVRVKERRAPLKNDNETFDGSADSKQEDLFARKSDKREPEKG